MSDPIPPTADALTASLDVPSPAEWREAVRVFGRVAVVFERVAPAMAPELSALALALTAAREPVAAVLAFQQLPPPTELPVDDSTTLTIKLEDGGVSGPAGVPAPVPPPHERPTYARPAPLPAFTTTTAAPVPPPGERPRPASVGADDGPVVAALADLTARMGSGAVALDDGLKRAERIAAAPAGRQLDAVTDRVTKGLLTVAEAVERLNRAGRGTPPSTSPGTWPPPTSPRWPGRRWPKPPGWAARTSWPPGSRR